MPRDNVLDPASPFIFSIGLHTDYISSLLVTAFEGGSNFWVHGAEPIGWTKPEGHTTPWYDDPAFVARDDFAFKLTYDKDDEDEGAGGGEMIIDRAKIVAGLAKMPEHAPHSLYEILNDNHDAIAADNFLQCVVFGDVVYG